MKRLLTTTPNRATRTARLGSPTLREETGAIAIIVALFMVGLLVCVALVVDLGSLYDHDRELQTAVDAGVLAGAQELFYSKGNTALAEAMTREYVSTNSAPNSSVDGANVAYELLNIDARSVEAQLRETGVEFAFAPVIGKTEGSVKAYAKAELMYLTGIAGLFPVALPYVHPDHFRMVYGDGAAYDDLFNEESGTQGDIGIYDCGAQQKTLGPGLHSVSVIARDKEDTEDLLTWSNIGSLYVPAAGSAIQGVTLNRAIGVPEITGELSEYVTLQLKTVGVTDEDVEVQIQVANRTSKLKLSGSDSGEYRIYAGEAPLSTPSFKDGNAEVIVTTVGNKDGTFPGGVTVARYTWFQRGEPLVYVSWDGSSASGSATLNPVIRTKVLRMNYPIMIKPQFHDEGDYQGNDFWANVIVGQNLRTELELALAPETTSMGSDWELEPDVGNQADDPTTLGNGYADRGEYLPYDNGVSVGHWNWIEDSAEGKTVYIPIVDPAANKAKEWKIQAFAAFEIQDVDIAGNRISIVGQFIPDLSYGPWGSDKPSNGLYVETAVLTK